MALLLLLALCFLVHCSNLLIVQALPTSRVTRPSVDDTRKDGHAWPDLAEPASPEPSSVSRGVVEHYQWLGQHGGRSLKQAEVDRRELVNMMLGVNAWLDRLLVKAAAQPKELTRAENHQYDIYGYATDAKSRHRPEVPNYRSDDSLLGLPPKLHVRPKPRCVRKRQTKSPGGSFGAFGHRDAGFIGTGSSGFRGASSDRSGWSQLPAGFGDIRRVSGSRHGAGKHAGFIPHRDADNPITVRTNSGCRILVVINVSNDINCTGDITGIAAQ